MNRTEMLRLLRELRQEKAEVDEEQRAIWRRARALNDTIAGLRVLLGVEEAEEETTVSTPASSPQPSADYPRGAEAIVRVLKDADQPMTVPEITKELIRRGWAPRSRDPQNATSSNAGRAVEVIPEVVRERGPHGSFLYRYEPSKANASTPEEAEEADSLGKGASYGETRAEGVTRDGEVTVYSS